MVDVYHAGVAGFMAASVWITAGGVAPGLWKSRWNAAVMAWLFCGATAWLAAGYIWNRPSTFYAGLAAALAALVLCKHWFAWRTAGVQVLNTLILLLVGLPLVDLALLPRARAAIRPETARLYYSFNAAKGDPACFARWEEYYQIEFDRLGSEIFMPAPESPLPFLLRPGSRGTLVNCGISINSLGFRGPEISMDNGGAYRIVTLGESTTFGMTVEAGDTPWPEMLEQIIRQRLKTRRPVQVINAGVPAYNIYNNIYRLPREISALHPDMIISYHGANGFGFIDENLLPPLGPIPPVYEERPVKLAADAEHRLRMALFRRRALREVAAPPGAAAPRGARQTHDRPPTPAVECAYGIAYGKLSDWSRSNGVRLVLANFSMAVNETSPLKVIDFYQGGGARMAYPFIRANAIHSQIVREVAQERGDICLVDTHPNLDGDPGKFIDVIHLTNEGRRQLAENVFTGIRATLERDLEGP
jgi:lysophospholipase L1-like esterase